MRKTVAIFLATILLLGVGTLAIYANTDQPGNNTTPPEVVENEKVDVYWEVDNWLEFELTDGLKIDFTPGNSVIQKPGDYTDPQGGPTEYKMRSNYQGNHEIYGKVHDHNLNGTGMALSDLQVNEKSDYGSRSNYTKLDSIGFRGMSNSWTKLAKYNHSNDLVDFEHRGNTQWLTGEFEYKLHLPVGARSQEYHMVLQYKATGV